MENVEKNEGKMKRYLQCLRRGWSILLIFFLIGIFGGLLIASLSYKPKYQEENMVVLSFRYTKENGIAVGDITSEENIERCKKLTKSLETGSALKTYQYVEIHEIHLEKKDGYYILSADQNAFNVGQDLSYNDPAAKGFLKHLTILPMIRDEEIEKYTASEQKGHEVFDLFDKEFYKANSLDEAGKIKIELSNPDASYLNQKGKLTYYSIWISSMGAGLLLMSLLFVYFFIDRLDKSVIHEYDNISIYRTPFHISLWKESALNLKSVKSLCMMAILLAFVLVAKLLPIPSGFGNLGISLGFIFLSVACMLYGPCPAIVIGALSDILGYLIRPDGMFFIGYTLQSMLACLTYALCFYKTHITYSRCLFARVIVNLLANVVIGGISWGIISGFTVSATLTYMLSISLPKNLIYLLPQSLVIYFVIKALARPMSAAGILSSDIADNISFF